MTGMSKAHGRCKTQMIAGTGMEGGTMAEGVDDEKRTAQEEFPSTNDDSCEDQEEEEELGRKTIRKHGLRHLQCTTETKKDRNT